MKYLQVRLYDETLLDRLTALAKRQHRSLNAQILWMLEQQMPQWHTIHYHWPPRCGRVSVSEGDTWSGNLDLVTCPDCREPAPDPGPVPGP